MSEPSSSLVAPLRALFVQLTRSGWGALVFWLVLARGQAFPNAIAEKGAGLSLAWRILR